MALERWIQAATDAVFDALVKNTQAGDYLKPFLAQDPKQLDFQLAFTRTLAALTPRYPEQIEALMPTTGLSAAAGQLIQSLVAEDTSPPSGATIAALWVAQADDIVIQDGTALADDFIATLMRYLHDQPALWDIITCMDTPPEPLPGTSMVEVQAAIDAWESLLEAHDITIPDGQALADTVTTPAIAERQGTDNPTTEIWMRAYEGLPADDQRRFRQLGAMPGGQALPIGIFAEVWQVSDEAAAEYAATLKKAGLLLPAETLDSYAMPLLLVEYARHLLEVTSEASVVVERTNAALGHHP